MQDKIETKLSESNGDGELARAVAAGDSDALNRLFDHIYPLIEREVFKYQSLPQCDRDEMASEVSLYLTREAGNICRTFRPGESLLGAYFATVIHRRCWRWYKRWDGTVTDREPRSQEGAYSLQENAVADQLDSRRAVEVIRAWKAGLDPIDQVVFEERMVDQRATADVGAGVGLSGNAVAARAVRLRRKLKERLRKAGLLAVALAGVSVLVLCLAFPWAYHGSFVGFGAQPLAVHASPNSLGPRLLVAACLSRAVISGLDIQNGNTGGDYA